MDFCPEAFCSLRTPLCIQGENIFLLTVCLADQSFNNLLLVFSSSAGSCDWFHVCGRPWLRVHLYVCPRLILYSAAATMSVWGPGYGYKHLHRRVTTLIQTHAEGPRKNTLTALLCSSVCWGHR